MFYIHQNACISPQQTHADADISHLVTSAYNKLHAIEPGYDNIPTAVLRRMGKAVRMGVGAALPLVQETSVAGVILGTSNGGMEDCIKFLNQIMEYQEGLLTPGNFVQSTANAIAAQIGLLTLNKGYNVTHVHRGLAFENAMLDAAMITIENPGNSYLLGGVDEISSYNYNIDYLGGWHKKEQCSSLDLYTGNSTGSLAGEGAAMFVVNNIHSGAIARIQHVSTFHSDNLTAVAGRLKHLLNVYLEAGEKIDLLISGENGDNRLRKFYIACEGLMTEETPIARFKHMTGEFATASAIALWLGCQILKDQVLPLHMIKRNAFTSELKKILIYNNYKGDQHSFILLSTP